MTAIDFHYKLVSLEDNLKRFAYKLTADKEDARDLVQETFLKALKYYNKYIYESNFKAWTYTIMKNTFINNYRRSTKQNIFRPMGNDISQNYSLTSDYFLPDSEYSSKEIEKTIDSLDDEYRLPFKMHYEGYMYQEIAEKLDVKLGTIKSRIFFARKQLREQVIR
jgi:RNA polymerase sigma-70 factor (ECF subfamily)